MAEINWTAEATQWLQDIFEFIATDNPAAAERVVSEIYEKAQVLREHPQIGYPYQESVRHIRILLYGHYRITYLLKDNEDVDIIGIFHGALDIGRYLV